MELTVALEKADANAYGERWGAFGFYIAAAKHMGTLTAMYGRRNDVTEYRTADVLKVMTAAVDNHRLQDLTNKYIQQRAQKTNA